MNKIINIITNLIIFAAAFIYSDDKELKFVQYEQIYLSITLKLNYGLKLEVQYMN